MSTEEYNKNTGFYKAYSCLDSLIWGANIPIAIVGLVFFLLSKLEMPFSIPAWIADYNYKVQAAVNSILILVLDNGHNRYHTIYTKHLQLTTKGNTLDLVIKIIILVATFVQIAVADSIVAFCFIAYLFTFLRNKELLSTLRQDNPLYKHVKYVWIPNNIRHNVTMFLFAFCFYSLKFKLIYYFSAWVIDSPIDSQIFLTENVNYVHKCIVCAFSLFFDFYWILRVLRKIKISKNTFFQMKPMKKLSKELEEYYENKPN